MRKKLVLGAAVGAGLLGAGLVYRRISATVAAAAAAALPAVDLSKARIIMIDSYDSWDQHKQLFIDATYRSGVIGVDCEWVSDPTTQARHKVALLQVAPSATLCFLIRLSQLSTIPEEVVEVLGKTELPKVGLDAREDARKLCKDYNVVCLSFLDLRQMVVETPRARALVKTGLSLQKLALDMLDVELDKSRELRCANWEADVLSDREITYAAYDALASLLIALKIAGLREHPIVSWFRPSSPAEIITKYFANSFDIPFREALFSMPGQVANQPVCTQPVKIKRKSRQAVRLSPYYENCALLAPDGEVLAGIKRRRAQWYLERGIAEMVSEDPFTVRLKFEPKGRAILDKQYYTISKENRCVVCGSTEELVCKNVVPTEYRSLFPDVMTRHNSHDVVLMCIDCHQRSNALNFSLRDQLATRCDAPLSEHKYVVNVEIGRLVRAAKALVGPALERIPAERRVELEETVKQGLKIDEVTPDLLREVSLQDSRQLNEEYRCHGQTVVEYFAKQEGGILELERMWRQHFLDTMKPAYLPARWSIDHHRKSMAYAIGQWEPDEADEVLKRIGLTREYIDQVMEEVRLLGETEEESTSAETTRPRGQLLPAEIDGPLDHGENF